MRTYATCVPFVVMERQEDARGIVTETGRESPALGPRADS